MYIFKQFLIVLFIFLTSYTLYAQPPGGMNPTEMVLREKQNLIKALPELTEDQKLLLDGIYDEFALSLKQNMEEVIKNRSGFNPEEMRAKMEGLMSEKDDLINDVLSDDQFIVYKELLKSAFGGRRRNFDRNNSAFRDSVPN